MFSTICFALYKNISIAFLSVPTSFGETRTGRLTYKYVTSGVHRFKSSGRCCMVTLEVVFWNDFCTKGMAPSSRYGIRSLSIEPRLAEYSDGALASIWRALSPMEKSLLCSWNGSYSVELCTGVVSGVKDCGCACWIWITCLSEDGELLRIGLTDGVTKWLEFIS